MPLFAPFRVLVLVALAVVAGGCSGGKDSPTAPSPTPGGGGATVYTAIGASDSIGVGSSVECFPFSACANGDGNGMGWVQVLFRRLRQDGQVTLLNLGVPGAVLSVNIEDLGRRVNRSYPGNFLTNQTPFVAPGSTLVTVFAGGNDANTIAQVVQQQQAGDNPRGFIDEQVRVWGEDYAALVRQIRQRAANARIVLLNLPNLAAAPYLARNSTFEKSIMQRIAVGMSERVNALAGPNVHVVDMLCDGRVIEPSSFSSDGFHPSDRGYALMAELAHAAATATAYPAPAADCALKRVFPPF